MEENVMEENVNASTPKSIAALIAIPTTVGAYTIFPECGCGCGSSVKVANALVLRVDPERKNTVDWFRPYHNPKVPRSQCVTFLTKEEE